MSTTPTDLTITYAPISIDFVCGNDAAPLHLSRLRHGYSRITATFCPVCDEQYWTNWESGVVHRGTPPNMDTQTYKTGLKKLYQAQSGAILDIEDKSA